MKWLVLIAWLAIAAPVAAQPQRPAVTAADRAKQHFERARDFAAAKQYGAAYDEFAAGYALAPRPLFLFNMGEMARALGHRDRAREHYERYIAAEPDGAFAATANQRLAELTAPPPAPAPAPAPVAAPPPPPRATAPARVPAPSTISTLPAQQPTTTATASFPLSHETPRPIYQRTGFWVGVGAAVVAGTVVVYAASRGGDSCSGNCIDLR
jgi:tetratricopeptide (TPR) repeat protein